MAFEGDLKNLPLADVLQTINQNNLTGTLSVKDTKGDRRIAFSQGFIVAFQPAPGEAHPVIDALAKRRIVARTEAEKARGGFLGKRKTLRLALSSRGLVTEEDYVKVVKEDVLEGIYELFLENDRTFKFEDGQTDLSSWDQDQIAAEIRLPSAPIVMEGARRCDEWGRIRRAIGSFNEVLVRDGDPDENDDETTKELLQLADGSRDLGTILDQLPVPRFKGCEAAASLIAARRLRPASVNEYVTLGQKAEEKGAFEEAASLYERGLSTERGNLTLRQRRANALERAGRKTEASDERKLLAAAFLEQGKRQDAAAELARAADLAPRDPAPLERRLQLAHEDQDKDVSRVTAARLGALYEDLGLADKARDTIRAHLARWTDDDEVREKLAELLQRQGDTKGAVAEWAELGNRAMRAEQLALAAARFRKALEVDPGDQSVRAILNDIESGEVVARRIRRTKRIWFTVTATIFFAIVAVCVREAFAMLSLQKMHLETGYPEVAKGTTEGAYAAIEQTLAVRDAYPWTFTAWQADQLSAALVEVFAATYERSLDASIIGPKPASLPVQPATIIHDRTQTILGDKGTPDSLEAIVKNGDDLLAKGDVDKAAREFERALKITDDALVQLVQVTTAANGMDWYKETVERIKNARFRAKAERARCLPLSPEVKKKLEDLLLNKVPPLK